MVVARDQLSAARADVLHPLLDWPVSTHLLFLPLISIASPVLRVSPPTSLTDHAVDCLHLFPPPLPSPKSKRCVPLYSSLPLLLPPPPAVSVCYRALRRPSTSLRWDLAAYLGNGSVELGRPRPRVVYPRIMASLRRLISIIPRTPDRAGVELSPAALCGAQVMPSFLAASV